MARTSIERSLKLLRGLGYTAQVVEHWIPVPAKTTVDAVVANGVATVLDGFRDRSPRVQQAVRNLARPLAREIRARLEENGRLLYVLLKRRDLYNVIDIVAIHPQSTGVLGVQATSGGSGGHVAHRISKSQDTPTLITWLQGGNQFEVHGWRQRSRAGRKYWDCDRREAVLEASNLSFRSVGNMF